MSLNPPESQVVDITPTPRILRTLGEIPFAVWQCFAELIDNSLDAFLDAKTKGMIIDEPKVDVYWSSSAVSQSEREVIVEDNGLGMEMQTLQQAAKAGYSNNDPINNLGLFGMGFNIATARLGDETIFLSATTDSSHWVGMRINFEQLIKDHTFSAPVIIEPKKHPKESGTKIVIRHLKEGILPEIRRTERSIRRRLENIYTPILSKNEISISVNGKQLSPRPHCLWSESRFVVRKGSKVSAIQHINLDLGETFFDSSRNKYLSDDESTEFQYSSEDDQSIPSNIVKRPRRLKGWLGIQRFFDPSEFGIDIIRNGRKILISDKELFGYENPDTGTFVTEYPVELGSTTGGRIVGELHADYLIPTYQKNGFNTTDKAWRLTVEAIRGAGPILPGKRKAIGYDGDNNSPLGKLVNAYRRTDTGTKNLSIPNALAKEYAKRFYERDSEYESDEKWYKAAQEVDRERSESSGGLTPVNTGENPSDDVSKYLPTSEVVSNGPTGNNETTQVTEDTTSTKVTSERNILIKYSEKEEKLSGLYSYDKTPGMEVTAWRLVSGQIKVDGDRVPCRVFQDGIDIDFFYDVSHPILSEYPISSKQLLLHGLSEKFAFRDPGVSIHKAFLGLVTNHLEEERINPQALQEKAHAILTEIRGKVASSSRAPIY